MQFHHHWGCRNVCEPNASYHHRLEARKAMLLYLVDVFETFVTPEIIPLVGQEDDTPYCIHVEDTAQSCAGSNGCGLRRVSDMIFFLVGQDLRRAHASHRVLASSVGEGSTEQRISAGANRVVGLIVILEKHLT